MKITHKQNNEITEITLTVEYKQIDDQLLDVLSYIEAYDSIQLKQTLIIKNKEGITFINQREIMYAEISKQDIQIHTQKETHCYRGRFYQLLEQLDSTFVQCSKSCIININYLQKLEYSFSGNMSARLKTGQRIEISRNFLYQIKQKIGLKE